MSYSNRIPGLPPIRDSPPYPYAPPLSMNPRNSYSVPYSSNSLGISQPMEPLASGSRSRNASYVKEEEDDEDFEHIEPVEEVEVKKKTTRGSRACTVVSNLPGSFQLLSFSESSLLILFLIPETDSNLVSSVESSR